MNEVELIKIIKACKVAGVLELKHGALEIRFQPDDAAKPGLSPELLKAPTDQELKKVEAEVIQSRMDDDLQSLQIDDPVLFEQLIVERELEFSGKETAYD